MLYTVSFVKLRFSLCNISYSRNIQTYHTPLIISNNPVHITYLERFSPKTHN